jgi:hypothetical protein
MAEPDAAEFLSDFGFLRQQAGVEKRLSMVK